MKYSKDKITPYRDRLSSVLSSISKPKDKRLVNRIKSAASDIATIIQYMGYYEDFESHVSDQLNKINDRLDIVRTLERELRSKLMDSTYGKVGANSEEIVQLRKAYEYNKLVKQQKFLSLCLFLDNSELEDLVSSIENSKVNC